MCGFCGDRAYVHYIARNTATEGADQGVNERVHDVLRIHVRGEDDAFAFLILGTEDKSIAVSTDT